MLRYLCKRQYHVKWLLDIKYFFIILQLCNKVKSFNELYKLVLRFVLVLRPYWIHAKLIPFRVWKYRNESASLNSSLTLLCPEVLRVILLVHKVRLDKTFTSKPNGILIIYCNNIWSTFHDVYIFFLKKWTCLPNKTIQ